MDDYDEYEEYEEEGRSRRPLLIIVIVLIALAVIACAAAAVVYIVRGRDNDDTSNLKIGYAAEAKVFLDEDSLSAAMQEAIKNAEDKNIALHYQNDAYSTDGKTFTCKIVNSERNKYDMFLILCTNPEWTDELLTTDLVPPGSGFEELTLDKALEPGDHTIYVVYTQVETDADGNQAIHNQTAHTMDFHVQ